jgi:hypothetical protein
MWGGSPRLLGAVTADDALVGLHSTPVTGIS